MNLLLGKLYVNEGLKNKAEEAYMMALRYRMPSLALSLYRAYTDAEALLHFSRQNPYALEATLALTSLVASSSSSSNALEAAAGSSDPFNASSRQREIEHFYTKQSMSSGFHQQPSLSPVDASWLQMLVTAHMSANRGHYRGTNARDTVRGSIVTHSLCCCIASVLSFEEFDRVFPENLHSLLHRGLLDMDGEHYHWAHFHFYRARQIDELNLSMMDVYADCLRKNGARTQLNNLVHELFAISETHAECWLAAAYYSEMKEDQETALQFCERAIMTNRRHAPAHLFRGELLLHRQRPEHALLSFSTASKLTKRLEAYSGMIASYCDLCLKGVNKYKEALVTAKSVVKLFSHKAESYLLLGTVFALRPENKEHARKAFQKALSMEPRKLEAIFGLVDLFVSDGEFDHAIDKLLVLSEHTAREEIFTKLADVYTLNKQFAEAMTCYHRSLSLNPSSALALRGLDRLEKIMRGEDPDGGNTTLDPDEYDESMEAGEYAA